jgi:hypothetical protein
VVPVDEPKKVKIGIQITDDEGGRFPREWLWAEPVQEDAEGGTYCLLNTAFYGPFALGDLVEARRKRDGDLMVSGLHRRGGRTSWLLMFSLDVPDTRIEQLADAWRATGTWVEGFGGKRISVAREGTETARPTAAEICLLSSTGEVELAKLLADPGDVPDDPVFRCLVA